MPRSFNTAGPSRIEDDYMLPASVRLPQVLPLIDAKKYFILHAPRQTGKTTALLSLAAELNGDSPLGVADMSGNVLDLTSSLFGGGEFDVREPEYRYPYDADDGREDAAAPPNVRRVLRGGAWSDVEQAARVALRNDNLPGTADQATGFRLMAGASSMSTRHTAAPPQTPDHHSRRQTG